MDPLQSYLTTLSYDLYRKTELVKILDTKIFITEKHIKCMRFSFSYMNPRNYMNIIQLFETYGYIFTENDYKYILKHKGILLYFIDDIKKTNELCEIAVQQDGLALEYMPKNKRTIEICKMAVQQNGLALDYIPRNKRTIEICEIAVRQNGLALNYVPENKKTLDICNIAMKQNARAYIYTPDFID